jgi:IS1 family transposase
MVICTKKQKHCLPEEVETGDCWIALSLAQLNGLILSGRVGKHTDSLAIELVTSTEGKTDCKEWHTDAWGGYERVLRNDEVEHYISKALTQRLERTNGCLRQQTGRWHRRQNKFGKVWEQTKVTLRLVITYFNWIWIHSPLGNTAAQRADLTAEPWAWLDIAVYSTLA